MVQAQQFFRLGSRSGKKSNTQMVEIFKVQVVFNNSKNYEAYHSDLAVTMKRILYKSNVEVKEDWKNKKITFFLKNNKGILRKDKNKIEVILKSWRKQLRKMMVCKFKIETHMDLERGIVRIYLK